MIRLSILFFLIVWHSTQVSSQIVINEIMASNLNTVADEDGSFSDWIELYNSGSQPVNLSGYGLTDNPANPFKWVFPEYIMQPGAYLLIFASGKNRTPAIDAKINGLKREVFLNIGGSSVDQLLSHPSFPASPSYTSILNGFFESPRDIGDQYGQKISGILIPPLTGNYTFWVAGDDNTRLYLSTNANPSSLSMIAEVTGWTNPREWNKYPQQRSNPIFLEAGKEYFIQGLMKEAFGGDHISVRWQWPDGKMEEPLEVKHCYIDGGQLHTNFNIATEGETIQLISPTGTIVDEAPPKSLFPNISWGRIPNASGDFQLIEEPTPGYSNGLTGFSSRTDPPVFEKKTGVYQGSVMVSFQSPEEGTQIRYTLNGSTPTINNSILYQGPFQVIATRTIRAIAVKTGEMPSEVVAETFNITLGSLNVFSSNLPLMIINQFEIPIQPDVKTPAYFTLIDQPINGRYQLIDTNVFHARINIEMRGSSSLSFPKKGYGFHIVQENGANRKVELLGMPAEHNWVLHGPYSDKSLMRNALAYEIAGEMGEYAPRTRFVELFMHANNDPLSNLNYHGVYLLVERIKIAPGRLDLAEMEYQDQTEPEITGGYIFKKDRLNPGETGFTLKSGNQYAFVRPQEESISPAQKAWLINYLENVHDAVKDLDYEDFIDPQSFIDYHLITELTKQIDGYRLSTFFHKNRGERLKLGPIWDFNLSWGNADYLQGWNPIGWYYPLINEYDYLNGWFTHLFKHEKFSKEYRARYNQLRNTIFSEEHLIKKLRDKQQLLSEAAQRNFLRWPVLGQYVWPNWFIASNYPQEIDWMEDWIRKRLAWMDTQLRDTTNVPPIPIYPSEYVEIIAQDIPFIIPIAELFRDPNGDSLSIEWMIDNPEIVEIAIGDDQLIITGLKTGETKFIVSADDRANDKVTSEIRILVYPAPYDISASSYRFEDWDKDNQEGVFPLNMVFLQSKKNDPRLNDELVYFYSIPDNEYASSDAQNIGFPYRNESRTRINGLGESGISFINTGRERDLGAAVVHVNALDYQHIKLSWTAATIRANSRTYHLRLQTRRGLQDSWQDVLDESGIPYEYKRNSIEGDSLRFEEITIPAQHANLFLRWKYYYTGQQLTSSSGARDMLRLDDIYIEAGDIINNRNITRYSNPLNVYPNPNQGGFLYFSEIISGYLYDFIGRPILKMEQTQSINLQSLSPGFYFLRTTEYPTVKIILTK
jgi:hypothetical protein